MTEAAGTGGHSHAITPGRLMSHEGRLRCLHAAYECRGAGDAVRVSAYKVMGLSLWVNVKLRFIGAAPGTG